MIAGAAVLLAAAVITAFGLPRAAVEWLDVRGFHKESQLVRGMGSEFMPPLNEGSLLFMPVLLPSTSLTEVKRIMAWQDRVMRETAPDVVLTPLN